MENDSDKDCAFFNFMICTVIIGLLCIVGITGNITAFFVLIKHKTETATVYLLQCLAVSDTILLITSMFVYSFSDTYAVTGKLKHFAEQMQSIRTYIWPLGLMAHTTTVWLTVLVTLNRFYAICRPVGPFKNYVLQATKIQVIVIVSFAILYNTPRFFEHQVISKEVQEVGPEASSNNTTVIVRYLGDNKAYQIIYSNILYFPVMYVVPLLSLTYLNCKLIKALNALRIRKESLTGHKQRDDHITVVIIMIVFVFILCQTPALINQIFWATIDIKVRVCGHFHYYYTRISNALVVLNSSTNFIIYCLFGKSFRRVFIETLCKTALFRAGRGNMRHQPMTTEDTIGEPLQLQAL